jgi:hypothetical protein
MHWRTSLATASCAASCSGVRSNFTPSEFGGGRSVPRGVGGVLVCCSWRGSEPDLAMGRGAIRIIGRGPERSTGRGAGWSPGGLPAGENAMCRTPMSANTHGRSRWFNWCKRLGYGVGEVMTPQAIRLPALPVGSVFMSSGFSWTMIAVPPLARMLLGEAGSSDR